VSGRRLPPGPAEVLDRSRTLRFTLDGRPLEALAGDTVASALAAAGETIIARSFKYHRPRGVLCMTGACGNCLCTVDGVPNLRACLTPVADGMKVMRQNAWPSARHDMLGAFDRAGVFMPAGFYYKTFHRPRFVWPMVEPVIRRLAGLGQLPSRPIRVEAERVTRHVDVLVIGGGQSGLRAAVEAGVAGRQTMLLEARPHLGGRLRSTTDPGNGDGPPGYQMAAQLEAEARKAGVDILTDTAALGIFEGPLVAAAGPRTLFRIRAAEIVLATGALQQPAVFPNNDLPGIMLGEAVDRLVQLYRVVPGQRAVVAAFGPEAQFTAQALREGGTEVTLINPPDDMIEAAHGRSRIISVSIRGAAGVRQLACDLLVIAGIMAPTVNLVAQTGVRVRFDESAGWFIPAELPEGIRIVGRATGRRPGPTCPAPAAAARRGGKQFACLCMDVTVKEMKQAIREGFDSIELLKRYTTLTMGPCQGKACLLSSVQTTAQLTGESLPATGVPTARPPWMPVSLGVLAAGHLTPRKETAMHDRHVAAGAQFMWAGDWRRPHHYQDPAEECRAVHERVALIDVSSLGKFRVKGPDAVQLLERLYPSKVQDLKVGRIRYGAMLNDQGVILDDGTICRLGDDEFFVTTTTGGTMAMEQWIRWWLADWGLRAELVNVSGGFAAVNLAGPRSRDVMQRITNLDVSPAALPYLMSARGELAGVPALILRIGFVGELSYEIHVPSAYGGHVWERIMEAGADSGIAAFGLEAQRILRLEKQHIIVGQDTDALSTPYGAGMSWMVKFDKEDFLGRRTLTDLRDQGAPDRLVGFTVVTGRPPVEGAAVIEGSRPVGRICSSRWSAAASAGVGLAWVPAPYAEEGHVLEIAYDGQRATARVTLKPFYDPEGRKLRS
jgi:sarcosine oxidase subunit alpha